MSAAYTWDDAAADSYGQIVDWHFSSPIAECKRKVREAFAYKPSNDSLETLFLELGHTGLEELAAENADPGAAAVVALLCRKQHDYGCDNILAFGTAGLLIRMHDKLARYENLVRRGVDGQNESLVDTLVDIVGYSTVGLMLLDKTFELPLRADLV